MKLENVLFLFGCAGTTLSLTTQEIVKEMGLGWNLGNTLEACGEWINGSTTKQYETAWGNPVTTEEIILGVKSYGFNTIRVPVAWSNLMSDNYTISPLLLARVEEVVNYIVKNDMYAIVNIHWDMGWFEKFATDEEEAFKKYTRVWEQITYKFKDFNEHLVLESLNEEGCWNDIWNRWSNAGEKEKAYNTLNKINQKFVDIVRQSGGNNEKRHLLLAGYCTDIDLTIEEEFVVPKDDRVMVSVHYYTPSTFTLLEEDADWGKATPTWGTDQELKNLISDFKKVKKHFVDKGIPIIVGEYGTATTNKEPESVLRWLKEVAKVTTSYGMVPCLWDAGQYFDRRKLIFIKPEVGELFKQLSSALKKSRENDKCWSEPNYPCCIYTCSMILDDGFKWASENGEWCGIPSYCDSLKEIKDLCPGFPDYPCCPTCDVFLTEEDGTRWGVLNNNWCGIKNSC